MLFVKDYIAPWEKLLINDTNVGPQDNVPVYNITDTCLSAIISWSKVAINWTLLPTSIDISPLNDFEYSSTENLNLLHTQWQLDIDEPLSKFFFT